MLLTSLVRDAKSLYNQNENVAVRQESRVCTRGAGANSVKGLRFEGNRG